MGATDSKLNGETIEIFGVYFKRENNLINGSISLDFEKVQGKERKISSDEFEILCTIGKGKYGIVSLVRRKGTMNVYAMKSLIKKDVIDGRELNHALTERWILGRQSHPFLVKLRYAFQTPQNLCFVMDFANGGDLWHHLQSGPFNEDRARFYAAEIFLALTYLHKLGIVYRDLKPENILLDHEGHVVLTDFGLAKILNNGSASTFCGTSEYIAPEVLKAQRYGKAVDWWAFGTLLFEMLVGLPPFYCEDYTRMYDNIVFKPLKISPSIMSIEAEDLIYKLLEKDPSKRLVSSEKIQNHPFFTKINWNKLYNKDVVPPYKPPVSSPLDLSMMDSGLISSIPIPTKCVSNDSNEHKIFDGFSFVEDDELSSDSSGA